jgi:hypothetical protein
MQPEENEFVIRKIAIEKKTIAVLPNDLKRLHALREPHEKSLYMTLNRILNIVEDSVNA